MLVSLNSNPQCTCTCKGAPIVKFGQGQVSSLCLYSARGIRTRICICEKWGLLGSRVTAKAVAGKRWCQNGGVWAGRCSINVC